MDEFYWSGALPLEADECRIALFFSLSLIFTIFRPKRPEWEQIQTVIWGQFGIDGLLSNNLGCKICEQLCDFAGTSDFTEGLLTHVYSWEGPSQSTRCTFPISKMNRFSVCLETVNVHSSIHILYQEHCSQGGLLPPGDLPTSVFAQDKWSLNFTWIYRNWIIRIITTHGLNVTYWKTYRLWKIFLAECGNAGQTSLHLCRFCCVFQLVASSKFVPILSRGEKKVKIPHHSYHLERCSRKAND